MVRILPYGLVSEVVGIDERTIGEYLRPQTRNDQKLDQRRPLWHYKELNHLNCRFERLTQEASGFAGGDSLLKLKADSPE